MDVFLHRATVDHQSIALSKYDSSATEYNHTVRKMAQILLSPGEMLFGNYQLVQNLLLQIEVTKNDQVIVCDDEFAVYGFGKNLSEALQDYKLSLIDFYEITEDTAKNHEPTRIISVFLKKYIKLVK